MSKPNIFRRGYNLQNELYYREIGYEKSNNMVEIEKKYDDLSIIRPYETPVQWADRVKAPLQELLSKKEYSVYHVYCLYAAYGEGVYETDKYYKYQRPRVHKCQMSICFKCWNLAYITVEQSKEYYVNKRHEKIREKIVVSYEDLMKNHWDHFCIKEKTSIFLEEARTIFTSMKGRDISFNEYVEIYFDSVRNSTILNSF